MLNPICARQAWTLVLALLATVASCGDPLGPRSGEAYLLYVTPTRFPADELRFIDPGNGKVVRRLQLPSDSYSLAIAPAGDRFAVLHQEDPMPRYVLSVLDSRGRGLWRRRLPNQGVGLAWSPDGTRLAYQDVVTQTLQIVRIGTDEMTVVPGVTTYWGQRSLDWSPDGQQLAFDGCRLGYSGTLSGICVVNLNGSGLRQLDPENPDAWEHHAFDPVWSPDGTEIAFVRYLLFRDHRRERGISVVSVASGAIRRVAAQDVPYAVPYGDPYGDTEPAWSADGKQIAFLRHFETNVVPDIAVAYADGSGTRRVTFSPEEGKFELVWAHP